MLGTAARPRQKSNPANSAPTAPKKSSPTSTATACPSTTSRSANQRACAKSAGTAPNHEVHDETHRSHPPTPTGTHTTNPEVTYCQDMASLGHLADCIGLVSDGRGVVHPVRHTVLNRLDSATIGRLPVVRGRSSFVGGPPESTEGRLNSITPHPRSPSARSALSRRCGGDGLSLI